MDEEKYFPFPLHYGFEISVKSALMPEMTKGEYATFLQNVRLGHEWAHEADLLFPGTLREQNACVIVECKNRPVLCEGNRILLPGYAPSEVPEDATHSILGKIRDAKSLLEFKYVRILVVSNSRDEFFNLIHPDVAVVSFSSLLEGWNTIVDGISPILRNSERYNFLRKLPRHRPWNNIELPKKRDECRRLQLIAEEIRHLQYLGKSSEYYRELNILMDEVSDEDRDLAISALEATRDQL